MPNDLSACILRSVNQMSLFTREDEPPVKVADLTRLIRERLESSPDLQAIWVIGEVSNVSKPGSGHLYFTLKDSQASLRCVMWKTQVMRLRFLPREGDRIEVHGGISVYDAGGQYQLYADNIRQAGQGQLFQEFLRLKAMLEAEGLFEEDRKRPIPAWPRVIGIVTSPTGAALQDMLNTLRRRFPLAEVVLAPTAVQGVDAPPGIVRALLGLADRVKPDVILMARGGGSIEDLWAFNDEQVVRSIAALPIPVITGVGHETDFTLADFAADLRAPTPTAAAELATPNIADLDQALHEISSQLIRTLDGVIAERRWALSDVRQQLLRFSPDARLRSDRQKLDDDQVRLRRAMDQSMRLLIMEVKSLQARLESANPLAVLQRGFSLVSGPDGKLVRSTTQVRAGDHMSIRVQDGKIEADVTGFEN